MMDTAITTSIMSAPDPITLATSKTSCFACIYAPSKPTAYHARKSLVLIGGDCNLSTERHAFESVSVCMTRHTVIRILSFCCTPTESWLAAGISLPTIPSQLYKLASPCRCRSADSISALQNQCRCQCKSLRGTCCK